MKVVSQNGVKLAMVLGGEDFKDGLSFFTDNGDFIQLGSWRYAAGTRLAAHNHNTVPRRSDRTQEAVVVLRGRLRASVYSEEDVLLDRIEAGPGEVMLFLAGGHGYEILEDDTVVVEVKNGPYPGPEADRRRLSQ
ncbi:hypothetical protein [Solidesulfovibrio sp.]|uniref:hypothetical protein n=1 Tax=Solidesulfovibrio sp. TaxID=2910990 RepID=UPI002639D79C|nr:hypothetical protein [Solidesulfovibrio sp.]